MKTSDFDFELPESFIAQDPAEPRDMSKLLVFDTANGQIHHKRFREIGEFLGPEDVLVLNSSKVLPVRLLFDADGAEKEIFVLKDLGDGLCQALVRPGKYFKVGRTGSFSDVNFEVLEIFEDGTRLIRFELHLSEVLAQFGQMPLPPYISDSKSLPGQYQTVYAREAGSVAAPTAGLHFTESLLQNLEQNGVEILKVILHVGRGTFLPVSTDLVEEHLMHHEEFELPVAVAEALNNAKALKKRVVAVGTTSVRVLESNFETEFTAGKGNTDIFIYPGKYQWKAVDRLITNFHLPKSTLIMLVASFLENKGIADPTQKVIELYEVAKKNNYRFYSFGDGMLII